MKEGYFTARGVTMVARLNAFGVPKADNEATYVVLCRKIFSSIEQQGITSEADLRYPPHPIANGMKVKWI